MLNLGLNCCIWLCTSPTDMRCSFDGLSALVSRCLGEDPSSGDWFVFINRRQTQLKLLAYEQGGYCLWSKRLEQGQFARVGSIDTPRTALLALVEGIELSGKKPRKRYKKAA